MAIDVSQIHGTDHVIADDVSAGEFVGTEFHQQYVWHVFDLEEESSDGEWRAHGRA